MTKSYSNIGIVTLLLAFFSTSITQNSNKIQFDVDMAQFKLDADNICLEVYYSIRQSDLAFVKKDENSYSAEALVTLKIYHKDSVWINQAWRVPSHITDSTQIDKANNILDLMRFQLKSGDYQLVAHVQDLADLTKRDSAIVNIELSGISNSKIALSDIELASSINKSQKDPGNVFYKNTLQVIPNPSLMFGEGLPMLYYYVEAYNLDSGQISDKYKTNCYVSNTKGDTLNKMLSRQLSKKKIGDQSVEVGAINIASLHSGTYYLHFSILDERERLLDTVSKKFYVYNPSLAVEKLAIIQSDGLLAISPFATMSEKELDRESDYIKYIIPKEGADFYENLTTGDAKRKFLLAFWQRRDPSTGTIFNEFRQDYLKKVRAANEKFKALGREGWHTDRGRVYLLYGPPNNVVYFRNTPTTKPYEIWTYYNIAGEGVVEFIFADITGFRDYRLLHSNKIGEVKKENWRDLITEHPN